MSKLRVLLLDTKKKNPNHYICLQICEALENHSEVELVINAEYKDAINKCIDSECNLFIAFDGEELDRYICEKLASICGRSVLWITEDPYEEEINIKNSNIFDIVYTNNSESVYKYEEKGRHLPFAASEEFHYNQVVEKDDEYLYDVFFHGTAWPNRVEFIKEITSELTELNLKIGLPYNEHISKPNIGTPDSSYLWRVSNQEFARMANNSRITLVIHRDFSASGANSIAATPGPRLFEMALAGAFQLVDIKLPEVNKYFQEKLEYVGYSDSKECIEKIKYYLNNSTARINIAKAAQRKAQKEHLYTNRVKDIVEHAKLIKQKKENRATRKPKILFVTHNIYGVDPYGGVEVFQKQLIESLGNKCEFIIYTIDRKSSNFGSKTLLLNAKHELIKEYSFSESVGGVTLSCSERETVFSNILTEFNVDVVHFQHLIGHIPSLMFIPRIFGIRTIFSAHDYYLMCDKFNLIDYQKKYCEVEKINIETCDICLNSSSGISFGSQIKRRNFYARGLMAIDKIQCNTLGFQEKLKAIYPQLTEMQTLVIPVPSKNNFKKRIINEDEVLNILILGNFNSLKGGDTIVYIINYMRDYHVEFTILGDVSKEYLDIFSQLKIKNLVIKGKYDVDKLAEMIDYFHISLHLSIWPETYCITLTECWKNGIIPIVSDIGALGERVINGKNGFKVPVGSPGLVIEKIKYFLNNRNLIKEMQSNISIVDEQEIYEKYFELYNSYERIRNPRSKTGLTINDMFLNNDKKYWHISKAHPESVTAMSGIQMQSIHSSKNNTKLKEVINSTALYYKKYGLRETILRIWSEINRRIMW